MWISAILLSVYGILFFISRKIELEKEYRSWQIPFHKAAVFLQGKRKNERKNKTQKQLESLQTIGYISWKEYQEKKTTVVLIILFFTLCISVFCSVFIQKYTEIFTAIERPSYGESGRKEEFEVLIEGEEKEYNIPVYIESRCYSEQEAKEKMENVLLKLDEIVLGENESFDEVKTDLVLPKVMDDGMVSIQWTLTPYGVISEAGKIVKEVGEEGEIVKIEAIVQCQDEKGMYTVFANIVPRDMTQEEEVIRKLEAAAQKQEEESRQKEIIDLPEEVDGKKVTWTKTKVSVASVICLFGLLLTLFFWMNEDQKVEKNAKNRENQMKMDYAVVVFKMRMLVGAGMTMRSAFFRIAEEYEQRGRKDIRYVYEEIVYSCREMESGVSEEKAYEHFGQRCGQSRYLKLGRILAQHLRKGTEGLEEILGQEMQQAQEERMALARQMGEEAGTKLLLPMGMMLVVVLVILIVPAFMNF